MNKRKIYTVMATDTEGRFVGACNTFSSTLHESLAMGIKRIGLAQLSGPPNTPTPLTKHVSSVPQTEEPEVAPESIALVTFLNPLTATQLIEIDFSTVQSHIITPMGCGLHRIMVTIENLIIDGEDFDLGNIILNAIEESIPSSQTRDDMHSSWEFFEISDNQIPTTCELSLNCGYISMKLSKIAFTANSDLLPFIEQTSGLLVSVEHEDGTTLFTSR